MIIDLYQGKLKFYYPIENRHDEFHEEGVFIDLCEREIWRLFPLCSGVKKIRLKLTRRKHVGARIVFLTIVRIDDTYHTLQWRIEGERKQVIDQHASARLMKSFPSLLMDKEYRFYISFEALKDLRGALENII